ncbi:phosphoribosylanthranilate isomerase [Bauldia sp.]|uniref:phosphoribosylanthranilate isomerase n=1 Tax=Bauldia sp. TaxID=2575872 RepID=UPI003BA8F4BF
MSLIVKICGLSTPDTIDAAANAGADMVGFMFFERSPRAVTIEQAVALRRHLAGRAESVAVTVDMDDADLAAIVDAVEPDWLQLHSRESVERVAEIRERFPQKVMKAVGIRDHADLTKASAYADVADALLLDAKPPKDADRPGGLGVAFDWTILDGFAPTVPWMLSGGLDPDNVAEAIRMTGAPGVDVSSGVETAPGRKDATLIRRFVAAARDAAGAADAERLAS